MKLKLVLACAILATSAFVWPPTAGLSAQAQNPQELAHKIENTKRERDALLAEQRRLEAELETVSRRGQSLASTVSVLDATRRKLANDIRLTQSKISSTNLNIRLLENSLDRKSYQISVHRQAIASTIQMLAARDSRPLVFDLLVSRSLSDTWGDRDRLENLGQKLSEEIELLRETRVVLGREKTLKEKSGEELLLLTRELGGQKQVVEENKNAQERLLLETRRKEAEYEKLIADIEAQREAFEAELFKYESELRMALDPSLYPEAKHGILSWPLDKVYITQRFGRTSASGRLYASGTHNGVDFRAAHGTPVRAVLVGTVEGVGNTDEQRGCYSYGRWILIRHPNGLSSLYSHLSASLVKVGEEVKTGQTIAYSGGTPRTDGAGYSTGPHLHLGLFATQGVEIRQFTRSRNCKEVMVPIANGAEVYLDPLAYLPNLN